MHGSWISECSLPQYLRSSEYFNISLQMLACHLRLVLPVSRRQSAGPLPNTCTVVRPYKNPALYFNLGNKLTWVRGTKVGQFHSPNEDRRAGTDRQTETKACITHSTTFLLKLHLAFEIIARNITYLLTRSLTHSLLKQSTSLEANRSSASQEIPRIL